MLHIQYFGSLSCCKLRLGVTRKKKSLAFRFYMVCNYLKKTKKKNSIYLNPVLPFYLNLLLVTLTLIVFKHIVLHSLKGPFYSSTF